MTSPRTSRSGARSLPREPRRLPHRVAMRSWVRVNQNTAVAIATAVSLGLSLRTPSRPRRMPLRFPDGWRRSTHPGNPTPVIVDYAHTPEALETLRSRPGAHCRRGRHRLWHRRSIATRAARGTRGDCRARADVLCDRRESSSEDPEGLRLPLLRGITGATTTSEATTCRRDAVRQVILMRARRIRSSSRARARYQRSKDPSPLQRCARRRRGPRRGSRAHE